MNQQEREQVEIPRKQEVSTPNHPDEPFLCPVLPFSAPDGWKDEE